MNPSGKEEEPWEPGQSVPESTKKRPGEGKERGQRTKKEEIAKGDKRKVAEPPPLPPGVVSGLRGRLQKLRSKISGREPVAPPPAEEGRKLESIEIPSSGEEDSFPALADVLQTGADLTQIPTRRTKKEKVKVKKRKKAPWEDSLVVTSGNTTRNLQSQLASSAVAAMRVEKEGQRKRKKKSSAEKVSDALVKALAPLGLNKVKKEKKDKKQRRRKKKKKKMGGDPSSSGGTSSSEESSSKPSEEEEESRSSEEMEAPMVK